MSWKRERRAASAPAPDGARAVSNSSLWRRWTARTGWALLTFLLCLGAAVLAQRAWRPLRRPPSADLSQAPGAIPSSASSERAAQTRPDRLPLDPLEPETSAKLIAEAGRVARNLVERFPRSADALEMLARYQLEYAGVEQAADTWRRCLVLEPQYAYAHVGLAKVATERGELVRAIEHWRRAILADPATGSHQIELGKALLAAGQADEAIQVLEALVKANPGSAQAHAELGSAQLQRRDNAAARASFQAALASDPRYATAHFGLATACARLGMVEEARQAEAKMREFRTDRTAALRGARSAYDDDQAAREDIARLYAEMGSVLASAGRADLAEQLWRRAARLDGANRASRQALSWLWMQQDQPLESIRMLRELARLEPDNAVYPAQVAQVYVRLGRVEDAQAALDEFVTAWPNVAAGHRTLAEFHLNVTGRPEAAREYAERAAELSGAAADWALVAAAQEQLGNLPAAIKALEQAIRLAPEQSQYAQLLALLKERADSTSAGDTARPRANELPQSAPDGSASGAPENR